LQDVDSLLTEERDESEKLSKLCAVGTSSGFLKLIDLQKNKTVYSQDMSGQTIY